MISPQDILRRVESLPPLPGTALRLIDVVNEPNATMEEVLEVVKYDQAVTGALLRYCNSAHTGLSRTIGSLKEAIVLLGTSKLVKLALSIHADSMLGSPQDGYGLERGDLWRHSAAVALGSPIVARRLKIDNANLLFTAGLLHDVGKVILNEYVADELAEIIRRVDELGQSFLEAEQETLGFTHAELGAMVAEQWKLPETIVRCIRYHHTPGEADPTDPAIDAVHIADVLCLMLGVGLGVDGLSYHADPAVMQRHNFTERDVEVLGSEMLTELGQLEDLVSDGRPYAESHAPSAR